MTAPTVATHPTVDERCLLVLPPDAGGRTPPPLVCAGFVSRLAAGLIDVVVLAAVIGVVNWLLITVEDLARPWSRTDLNEQLLAATPFLVVGYFVVFWRLTGQTVGKWLLGLRVVSIDGGPITIVRAIVRVAGYILSAVPLYAGYFLILADPHRRALHDRISRTAVVYADTT